MYQFTKRRKAMLSLLGGLLLGGSLMAQGQMSLRDCIDYSLKHHSLLTISNNDIASAHHRVREGLSAYLPQVNGQVTWDDNIQRPTTVIPAGTFSPQEIRVQFGNQYATNAMVQLDQTIYDRSLLLGLKALDPYADVAGLTKEKNEQQLMYGVAMSYYAIQIYIEQLKLLVENETKFAQMEDVLRLQVSKGVARKVDLDRVTIALANIRVQKDVIGNEIESSYFRLKNAIGMPLDEPLTIEEGKWNREQAMNTNPVVPGTGRVLDLMIQQKTLEMQELEVRRKRSAYLPTLGAYFRAGGQAFGDDFGKSFENWYGYASLGVKLNVPIWNSFRTDASVKQSELLLSNARENFKMTKANIDLQLQNAENQWRNAQSSLDASRLNMELAQDLLDVTQLQMNQGVATLSDFLTADYSYKEAQTNYITSLLKVVTARLDYEKAAGTLQTYLLQ